MAIIEVENLGKSYLDGTIALADVSFKISKGEFVAIMGPSGSGKSTLLHVLGFLDKQTSGVYRFNGKTIDDYSENEIARVRNKEMGFVFQSFNLLPRTTVLENVKLPLLYSNTKKSLHNDIAAKAIDSVGLSHRINHESSQLSGGERQRVAIARALVNNPSVIFADEPTGNLDSKSGQMVMEFIQNLNEKDGHTIILITHETHIAEHAQRIIKILDGRVESDSKINNRRSASKSFKK